MNENLHLPLAQDNKVLPHGVLREHVKLTVEIESIMNHSP